MDVIETPHEFCYDTYYCFRCGTALSWESDNMLSEVGILPEDTPLDDDALSVSMLCPHCGLSYMVNDTPPADRKDYPYWKPVIKEGNGER